MFPSNTGLLSAKWLDLFYSPQQKTEEKATSPKQYGFGYMNMGQKGQIPSHSNIFLSLFLEFPN